MNDKPIACGNCRHWHSFEPDDVPFGRGLCKRYPPTVNIYHRLTDEGEKISIQNQVSNDFPATAANEVCGEWATTDPEHRRYGERD